ncbi:hypothetical protein AA11826_1967 [Komagataeibacter oboediens DSM 11826]|nr:hypothetical protein AA11826_1967 [Komagataeibacter oboediens DSM 11826]
MKSLITPMTFHNLTIAFTDNEAGHVFERILGIHDVGRGLDLLPVDACCRLR